MVKVIKMEGFVLFIVITLVSFADIQVVARLEKTPGEAHLATTVPPPFDLAETELALIYWGLNELTIGRGVGLTGQLD